VVTYLSLLFTIYLGGPQASILRQVTLPILPRFFCYLIYFRFGFSGNHLCAGGQIRGGRDACHVSFNYCFFLQKMS
jgi:hypothetical protein